MAQLLQYSTDSATAKATAVATLLNNGYLRLYTSPQPASAEVAITTQTLLAELRFADPAAASAVDGIVTFDTLTPAIPAVGDGTATWFRCLTSGGAVVFDGTVTEEAPGDLTLSPAGITTADGVEVTAFTYKVPRTYNEWPDPVIAVDVIGEEVSLSYPDRKVVTDGSAADTNVTIVGDWGGARTILARATDNDSITWTITPALEFAEPFTVTYDGPSGVIARQFATARQAPAFAITTTALGVAWNPSQLSDIVDYGIMSDTTRLLGTDDLPVATPGQALKVWKGQLDALTFKETDTARQPEYQEDYVRLYNVGANSRRLVAGITYVTTTAITMALRVHALASPPSTAKRLVMSTGQFTTVDPPDTSFSNATVGMVFGSSFRVLANAPGSSVYDSAPARDVLTELDAGDYPRNYIMSFTGNITSGYADVWVAGEVKDDVPRYHSTSYTNNAIVFQGRDAATDAKISAWVVAKQQVTDSEAAQINAWLDMQ